MRRERLGKERVQTWAKMKRLLKKRFLPKHYVQEDLSRFHKLVQGNYIVEDYARRFTGYLIKCELHEDEPQTLIRFLGGLDTRIAHIVDLDEYDTLEQLVLLAYNIR